MPDLKDQIRTYYETTTEPVDIDAITVDPGTVLVGPFPDAAQRRSAMQTVTPETPPTNRLWRGLAAAAAVALIVVAVGVALLLASGGGDEIEPASPDDTVTVDAAVTTAHAYFAAYEIGDFTALADLFAPDAEGVIDSATAVLAIPDLLGPLERYRIWNVAQGTTTSPVECSGVQRPSGVVDVRCTYEESSALHHAVGAPPVSIAVNIQVGPDGIISLSTHFREPGYIPVMFPFDNWMNANHPNDAAAAGFANWTSLEEAERFGAIRAQYAELWAAYLIANGCPSDLVEEFGAYEIC